MARKRALQPANPIHPGAMLLEEFLKPADKSQAAFAHEIGWTKTRLNEFIVPHLANKYHGQMGVPSDEFDAQVRALSNLGETGAPTDSLFNPETRAPGFRWSKHLYQSAGERVLALVPSSARRLLSIGATTGQDEAELERRGLKVSAVPLDAVFGAVLQSKGGDVRQGPLTQVMSGLATTKFDAVLAVDVLHLLPAPAEFLRAASRVLSERGEIVGSVSNTSSWLWLFKDLRGGRRRWVRPRYAENGAQPMSERRLKRLCKASGLDLVEVVPAIEGSPALARIPLQWVRRKLAPQLHFRIRRGERTA